MGTDEMVWPVLPKETSTFGARCWKVDDASLESCFRSLLGCVSKANSEMRVWISLSIQLDCCVSEQILWDAQSPLRNPEAARNRWRGGRFRKRRREKKSEWWGEDKETFEDHRVCPPSHPPLFLRPSVSLLPVLFLLFSCIFFLLFCLTPPSSSLHVSFFLSVLLLFSQLSFQGIALVLCQYLVSFFLCHTTWKA